MMINRVAFANEGDTTTSGDVTFAGSGSVGYGINFFGASLPPFGNLSAAYSNVPSGGIPISRDAQKTRISVYCLILPIVEQSMPRCL